MTSDETAFWCLDAAWVAWLLIWIAMSPRVKITARRESLARRAAHLVPMTLAGALMLLGAPFHGTWLATQLLPRAAWMPHAGAALVGAGLVFAVWARLVLAGNWSGTVTLKQDHALVRTGPYALVRHPIYTGLLTAMLGTAIAIDQVRGAVAFVIITAAFVGKMRTEEAFMVDAFGAGYEAYRARVAALIPFLW